MIFCAGHSKIDSGEQMAIMIQMFRDHGMGNIRDLLIRLSTNPGMVYYLDNSESIRPTSTRTTAGSCWSCSPWASAKMKSSTTLKTT